MSASRMRSFFMAWMLTLLVVFYALPAYSMYSWALIGLSATAAAICIRRGLKNSANIAVSFRSSARG